MSWEQWPFRPQSLTDMIGPSKDASYNERFVSLLVSGCSERLGRALTVLEPELDTAGEPVEEPDPNHPGETRLKLRRIDQINPREHFAKFCAFLRELPGQEEACRHFDENIARQVIRIAKEDPKRLGEFVRGYLCRSNLIDQVGVIRYYRTPVAVVFSGQFLPDGEGSRTQLCAFIDNLVAEHGLSEAQRQELQALADKLETRDRFIQRYIREREQREPSASAMPEKQKPTVSQLFLDEVKEIERIACAQFQMHKRNRESTFRHELRQKFPALPAASRGTIAERTQPILEKICRFCGTTYLALFVSLQRYISYEGSRNLLSPFALAGIRDEIKSGILHFNWRKAGLTSGVQSGTGDSSGSSSDASKAAPTLALLTQHEEVQRALRNGLKGGTAAFFSDATMLCQMYLSDAYRAVLIWGPFPHLTPTDLKRETNFLEEVSELVMMRVLSLVQLCDSERRTTAWGDVAGLLVHHSRRAMTPVSTGVRIISDHLRDGRTYSKQDALRACDSLEAASRFIAQAVRAPLFSFAAMAEEAYEFAPASLDAIVRDCVALYLPMALDKMVTVKVDPSVAELPKVEVDAVKLRDAIGYVLDNAIKYSHRNKEVRIYGSLSGRDVRLTIEDFGQGIEEDELHLIFGRGYQGRRSRKATYEEGEGMGLFHARLIVEAHKGKIWCGCRSGPRHEGSAKLEGYRVWFTFELPIKQSDA